MNGRGLETQTKYVLNITVSVYICMHIYNLGFDIIC